MKYSSILLAFSLALPVLFNSYFSQCTSSEIQVEITIIPDNYPAEVSWDLTNHFGQTIAQGTFNDTVMCLDNTGCYNFTIYDSFGDGICCSYGNGSYTVSVDGNVVANGGNYTSSESTNFNCPAGFACNSAITISEGNHTALNADTWYLFQPANAGMFEISTCSVNNTCDTKIWIYETCTGLIWDNSNVSTLYYDNNSGNCNLNATINAALDPTQTYIIRIGDNNGDCGTNSIDWFINYTGPISGCMDVTACNYNPLATVSDGNCLYYPNTNCPNGPDLMIEQAEMENSLYIDYINSENCQVQENCLTGYGMRTILRFTTWIKNIGDVDYFIGNPTDNPSQFSFVNCHNHAHYPGYAEYILFRDNGNPIPIGFKNGFCVMDLECSGGGTAKYGCNNMGITAHCGDIYSSGLECQWIDITDVDPGDYIFAVRINWNQAPDALGRYEMDYDNNWAQVCLTVFEDANGDKDFTVNPNCSNYQDCNGTPFGSEVIDCEGTCGGATVSGDLNTDTNRDLQDVNLYTQGILTNNIAATPCTDMNDDGIISVWDAALIQECFYNGTPFNNACVFPHGLYNPFQTSHLIIDEIDLSQNYIDIYIQNPSNFVKAFEFNLSGLNINTIIPLYNTTNFNCNPQYNSSGKIIGIATDNSFMQKNTNATPFLRVYHNGFNEEDVCISEIVHFVNADFEAIAIDTLGACQQVQFAGLNPYDMQNYLIISPNPAQDLIYIQSFISGENAEIQIKSISGQVLYKTNVNSGDAKIELDISAYAKGIYLIELHSEHSVKTQKLVKE